MLWSVINWRIFNAKFIVYTKFEHQIDKELPPTFADETIDISRNFETQPWQQADCLFGSYNR